MHLVSTFFPAPNATGTPEQHQPGAQQCAGCKAAMFEHYMKQYWHRENANFVPTNVYGVSLSKKAINRQKQWQFNIGCEASQGQCV